MRQRKPLQQFQHLIQHFTQHLAFAAALALLSGGLASFGSGVEARDYATDVRIEDLAPAAQPESAQPQQAAPTQPTAEPESLDAEEDTALV